MTILAIKTDASRCYLGIMEDYKPVVHKTWEAHRRLASTIYTEINGLLKKIDKQMVDIDGIVAYSGPGSFTGLRIGLSVANALAYSLPAKVVATSGQDWMERGVDHLLNGENQRIVLPEYGSEAHISSPKR